MAWVGAWGGKVNVMVRSMGWESQWDGKVSGMEGEWDGKVSGMGRSMEGEGQWDGKVNGVGKFNGMGRLMECEGQWYVETLDFLWANSHLIPVLHQQVLVATKRRNPNQLTPSRQKQMAPA